MNDLPKELVKVRAGFYRVGALVIQKGAAWCVYQEDGFLPKARFGSLQEAAWWAHHNQPKEPVYRDATREITPRVA